MEQMEQIQGITPRALWIFAGVAVGLLAIALMIFKLVEFIQGQADRRDKSSGNAQEPIRAITIRLTAIEDRLDSIDGKLDSDKRRIESLEGKQNEIQNGFRALCTASLALLNHEMHNGNGEEMEAAQKSLQAYLVNRV